MIVRLQGSECMVSAWSAQRQVLRGGAGGAPLPLPLPLRVYLAEGLEELLYPYPCPYPYACTSRRNSRSSSSSEVCGRLSRDLGWYAPGKERLPSRMYLGKGGLGVGGMGVGLGAGGVGIGVGDWDSRGRNQR